MASAQSVSDFIEDVEWLLDNGETHIEHLARRFRLNPDYLTEKLRRNGRTDLARRIHRPPTPPQKRS